MRGLTFELTGRRRQGASARAVKMYRVPPTGRWWPAVGAPVERGVRRLCTPPQRERKIFDHRNLAELALKLDLLK